MTAARRPPRVAVVIDAFRAFATACYVLDRGPLEYLLTTTSETVARLAREATDPLLIGKPEVGANLAYDVPNSPLRALGVPVAGRTVIHRTQAGAKGVLAVDAEGVIAASLVNVPATARALRAIAPAVLRLVPMGHEASTPTLEDDLCGAAIASLLEGGSFDLTPFFAALREGPGRYFFGDDQRQYPAEDFELCTAWDRFDFAIRADRMGGYARLVRCWTT